MTFQSELKQKLLSNGLERNTCYDVHWRIQYSSELFGNFNQKIYVYLITQVTLNITECAVQQLK